MSNERFERGLELLKKIDGEAGEAVLEALADFPDMAEHMVAFAFGDIYARPGLSLRDRELVTLGALVALGHARPQLKVHLNASLNVGITRDELAEVMLHAALYTGFPAALNGLFAAKEVFAERDGE